MAYRLIGGLLVLLWGGASAAAPARVALVVEGGGDRHDELGTALARALDAQLATQAAPADLAGQQALRTQLEAARLVMVRAVLQGRDRYTLAADAIDPAGVTHRFGDANGSDLVAAAVKLVADLPPLPPPAPAVAPAAAAPEPPPVARVAEPESPAASIKPVHRRHHPYQMLVAGVVSFFVPYFTTVGFAANYQSYNANAAHVGYIPMAGPFLARQRISDKDLKDGYDPGLLVDGIVQTLTFNLLIAGIVYCAVGEKRLDYEKRAHVRPLLGLGREEARVGAVVSW